MTEQTPIPMDAKHPVLAPAIEIMKAITFQTPAYTTVSKAVSELHEQVGVRIDPTRPLERGNRAQMRGIVLVGPSRSSKTFSTKSALRDLPPITSEGGAVIEPNTISFDCSAYASMNSFLTTALTATGYRLERSLVAPLLIERLLRNISRKQFTTIHIDEFQWALKPAPTPGRNRAEDVTTGWNVLSAIAGIPDWPTPLIVSGLPEIVQSLNVAGNEMQAIRNRFRVIELPPMTMRDAKQLPPMVGHYRDSLGVRLDVVDEENLSRRLVHAGGYAIGVALELAQIAVARASIKEDRTLTVAEFAGAYAALTNCRDAANPFISQNWAEIDTTIVAAKNAGDRREENVPTGKNGKIKK